MNHSIATGEALSPAILCGILSPGVITNTVLVVAYVTLLFAACVENTTVIYLVRTYIWEVKRKLKACKQLFYAIWVISMENFFFNSKNLSKRKLIL